MKTKFEVGDTIIAKNTRLVTANTYTPGKEYRITKYDDDEHFTIPDNDLHNRRWYDGLMDENWEKEILFNNYTE